MDRKIKIYSALFLIIVGFILYADATKPKEISWFPSYAAKHKIPYGTYLLKTELATLFPETKITEINKSPYMVLKDSTLQGTYFFVDESINFGKEEFDEILTFVAKGNDVFLASNGANIDTLQLKTESFSTSNFDEKFEISLFNKHLTEKKYAFDKPTATIYFKELDTLNTVVLGKVSGLNAAGEIVAEGVNFIKQPFGKGNFYIHTFPLAFTNYNLLKDENATYVSSVLSYLDAEKPILWDAYYKAGNSKITSPLQYIFSSKNLKWAYCFALIGLVFFFLFKSKREQRFIPVRTPLKNQTVAFTRTIANMYYEKSAHKDIATHKINYFLDFIRTKLRIPTNVINTSFYEHLAARSANSLEEVTTLFDKIAKINQKNSLSKTELIELNTLIEEFKNPTSATKK